MLREQISAQPCWLWDVWGAGSTGEDLVVPAGV